MKPIVFLVMGYAIISLLNTEDQAKSLLNMRFDSHIAQTGKLKSGNQL